MMQDLQDIQFIKKEGGSQDSDGERSAGSTERTAACTGRKKKNSNRWLIIVIVLLAAVILTGILEYWLISSSGTNYGGGDPYVAVLHVEGTIQSSGSASSQDSYQHDWQLARVDELMQDRNNRGLLLYVNSPGGAVYQSDELYLKLKEYKEKTGRPFYVYFAETAASGAYYISAGADYICANRNTQTGSIGVYMGPVISAEEFLDRLGIKADIIKSGENKAVGSGYEDMTDEQRAIYQSLVDEMYGRFVSIVAEGRGMSEERVRELGDGRVYTAQQALENGLIDKVCTYEEAILYMREEENLKCSFVSISYAPKQSLLSTLLGLQESVDAPEEQDSASEAESVMKLIEEYSHPQFYYKIP